MSETTDATEATEPTATEGATPNDAAELGEGGKKALESERTARKAAPVRVRARATVGLTAPSSAARFDVLSAQVAVAGLPFGGPIDVTTSLYGPYDTATQACTGNHRDVVQRRPGNGTFTSLSFQVEEAGWYAWRASVPEGDLWLGATSTCGAVGTLTQVSP